MCGIVGFLTARASRAGGGFEPIINRMSDAIAHRGPDDSGTYVNEDDGIGLGYRRLAILDLSQTGHQPMASACGRYVIVFNGEIYNFTELKQDLAGASQAPAWRGSSDTEVLLAAIVAWGFEAALKRFNGMFAIALWDCEQRTLTLARDRAGEKPLYYGVANATLLFGSELKSLRLHPAWSFDIDRDALCQFMRYSYVPSPWSIYRGIFKLPAGSYLTLSAASVTADLPAPVPYWRALDAVVQLRKPARPQGAQSPELLDELDSLLRDAVRMRMVADVPLGAFLSGGFDSTLIVALMQQQSARPVKTFTIGFPTASHDEAPFARKVAQHLGTSHTEHYVDAEEALAYVPRLAQIYDEPFADSSQIPTLLVSKLARKSVTVALTGDGGDEIFGGYNRYVRIAHWWRAMQNVPRPIRLALAAGLGVVPATAIEAFGNAVLRRRGGGSFVDMIQKIAAVLPARSIEEAYRTLTSIIGTPNAYISGVSGSPAANVIGAPGISDPIERMMYLDFISYLPDDILVKLDRATMAVSLEGRVPFLDYRIVEWAWRQPLGLKIGSRRGKLMLRNLAYRYVPRVLLDRPKTGFGIPLHEWLRGPLRNWADNLLAPDAIKKAGYFEPLEVSRLWSDHRSGRHNRQNQIWNILMFNAWLVSKNDLASLRSCS